MTCANPNCKTKEAVLFFNGLCYKCHAEVREAQRYFNDLLAGINKKMRDCPDKPLEDVTKSPEVLAAETIIKNHERSGNV